MGDFENDVVKAFNSFFRQTDTKARAYRLKQARFTPQVIDVLTDSPDSKYYMAIECKTMNGRKYTKNYFRAWSRRHGKPAKVHQVISINRFIEETGRAGYLAAELRQIGPKGSNLAYLVPWKVVMDLYTSGDPGISSKVIMKEGIPLKREKGNYFFEGWGEVV